MSNTPQTEAQRLSTALRRALGQSDAEDQVIHVPRWTCEESEAELRRLDAENKQQRAALERKSEAIQKLWAERDQLRAQVERLQATEPFGHFRAEPFGWTDCAATDEGAIALYERPAAPAVPQGWTDADSDAARLALELECLLLDTETLSVVSKWWASANEALELHRRRLATLAATSSQPVTLTDEMVTAGGRALCEIAADSCNVDREDNWKMYGEVYKSDAKACIIAALREKELT